MCRRIALGNGAVETCRGLVGGVILCIMALVSLPSSQARPYCRRLQYGRAGSHYAANSSANTGGAGTKASAGVAWERTSKVGTDRAANWAARVFQSTP